MIQRTSFIALAAAAPLAIAAPQPAPGPEPTVFGASNLISAPEATPAPELVDRGLGDDIKSYIGSLGSDIVSDITSFVGSGILDFPSGFPTGTAVQSSLGISDDDLVAKPTQVLNLPPYGNWTSEGWNVRVHGNVYKIPDVDQDHIDDLANVFIIGKDVSDLDDAGKAQARNVTKSIFVVQQADENVTMHFVPDASVEPDASGGVYNATGGAQNMTLPYKTTAEGDFDVFVKLDNTTGSDGGYLLPGNETSKIQAINVYANGTDTGNATAYLVPPEGITVVSDIDDILRVTKIYEPKEGLINTFAKPFEAWMNMPEVYANWSATLTDFHFHYLTTTPEQITRNYMDFIYKTYPLGSFDTRPLNFSDISATLSIRKFLLDKVFETFPQRQFVLVGDTTNADVMKDYPTLYHDHPDQVLCILLRNTSSTDSGDKFPYDTSKFKDIPQENYMFFNVPDDLKNLDIAGGNCWNSSIAQNVTFDQQGLPFGLGDDGDSAASYLAPPKMAAVVAAMVLAFVGADMVPF